MEQSMSQESTDIVLEYRGRRFYKTTYFNIPCIRSENNYYNFTKIVQDHGYRDLERITRAVFWKDYFDSFSKSHRINVETCEIIKSDVDVEGYARITESNIMFSIMNQYGVNKCLNGRYYPKQMLPFLCIHINQMFSDIISEELNMLDDEIHKKESSLEERIKQQASLIESLQMRLRNSNAGFNHEHPGSIVIHETSGCNYKLTFKVVNVQQSDYPDDVVVPNVYNIDKMKQLILFYTKNNCIEDIQHIGASIFKSSIERIIGIIEELQSFKFHPAYNIDDLIHKHVYNTELATNNYNSYIGTLFELYCAKRFSLPIYRLATAEFLSLSKQDHGVDLMDIDRMIIAQCKYYSVRTLDETKLKTFMDFCQCMDDWHRILYINSSAKISSDVIKASENNLFEIVRIDDIEFNEFMKTVNAIENDKNDVERIPVIEKSLELNSDIERFIIRLLEEKDKWPLSELLARVNLQFGITISQEFFIKHYKHLYAKNRNGNILRDERTHPIVSRNVENEEEWIRNYVGFGEYVPDELIAAHNEHFNTSYTRDSYTRRFGTMFEHNKNRTNELFKRQINKKQIHLYRFPLNDEMRNDFRRFIEEHQNLTLTELINEFNSRFHRFENTVSIKRLMEDSQSNEIVSSLTMNPVIRSASDITDEMKTLIRRFVSDKLHEGDVRLIDMLKMIEDEFHLSFTSYAFKHICSSLYMKTYDKSIPKNENGESILQSIEIRK